MKEKYISGNTKFYNELEALAVIRKNCELIFIQGEGRSAVRGRIEDVFVRNETEFVKMDSGLEIRIDKILRIDEKIITGNC